MDQDQLQQYARDPRNTRRQLQEADDIQSEPAVAVEAEKPQQKKSKR